MKFFKYIFAISLIVSCKPKENKSSVKSLGFESAQLSCEELHLQFHYDYEHLRYLWSEFQSPESSCNKKLLDIVADGGEDSRDRLPDILEVEQLRQLALEENINNARRQMISISSPPLCMAKVYQQCLHQHLGELIESIYH